MNSRVRLRTALKASSVFLAATLGACALWDEPVVGFDSPRLFTRANYRSAAECAVAETQGLNCTSSMRLCPNGSGWVTLGGDILDPVEYTMHGDLILVKAEYSRVTLLFTLASDGALLPDGRPNGRWERDLEEEARLGSSGCL